MKTLGLLIIHFGFDLSVFTCTGERLTDEEVESIIKSCEIEEDLEGNVKYEGSLV